MTGATEAIRVNRLDPEISFPARLMSLGVGETAAQAHRYDGNEVTKEDLILATAAMRNSIAASVKRASAKTGHKYTVENGDFRTRSYDVVIVVAVTRTE
jgi:hypothetical protein